MAINYASMKATAARLILENGTPATLTREDPNFYDPITDIGTGIIQSWPTNVVLSTARDGSDIYDIQTLFGSYEIGKLMKALIPGSTLPAGIIPQPGDKLDINGVVWAVIGNNPIKPNDESVLHICFVAIE